VARTLGAQALLAGIAERGADAVGCLYRSGHEPLATVVKQQTPPSLLFDSISVPDHATQLLVHVRDYTKGHPSIAANNHPVRHGPVVGVHNGMIVNDGELLSGHRCARLEPRMTVDSEAVFALAAHARNDACALEALRGSAAAAWIDEREPDCLYLARAAGRPLWLATCKHGVFFASTRKALEVVEQTLQTSFAKREVAEGTLVALADGRIAAVQRFGPDRTQTRRPPPTVPAAEEGAACLARLAVLAPAAA
jgi:glucosamine 6-phosphate synthetase-like amidotransferase/phosphosugar isomerase protein